MDILTYSFLQKAFLVAIIISIITPIVGNIIVLKRLSSVGDALSHNSLAGVAIGLFLGVNPILVAVIVSISAALLMEVLRLTFPKYSEISTSIILSLGVGLASVFSSISTSTTNFNNFLFGSIVVVSNQELYIIIILALIVVLVSVKLYHELFYITFDEENALVSGVKVKTINLIYTILTAIVISISARTVGALVVSSLIVLPVATSIQISKSYISNIYISIVLAMFFTISGLFISYWYNLKPGGTIALIGVVTLLIILVIKKIFLKKLNY